jgi:competence protein ComEC
VYQRPQKREQASRLFIEVESVGGVKATGRMMVHIKSGTVSVMTGDRLTFVSRIREPRNFGIPGEHDFRRALATQDIFVTGYLADSVSCRKKSHSLCSAELMELPVG